MKWHELLELTDRQIEEIEFSKLYAEKFNHGTDGHNAKVIIAKLAGLLDAIEDISDVITSANVDYVIEKYSG